MEQFYGSTYVSGPEWNLVGSIDFLQASFELYQLLKNK